MNFTDDDKKDFTAALWMAVGYVPTSGEWPIYNAEGELVTTSYGQIGVHEAKNRIKLISGGTRAGKSKVTAMEAAQHILIENGLMWIIGPDYTQAKAEFIYLHNALQMMGMVSGKASTPEIGPQKLTTTWGFKIETKSGADLASLASFAPDVIPVVEADQMPIGVLDKAFERGLEKRAPIIISGTIEKAQPWYSEKWAAWQGPNPQGAQSFSLPSWSNTQIFPGGREDPAIIELEALLGTSLFLERCAGIPSKPTNLVHGAYEPRKHNRSLPFNDKLPVQLAIDPAKHTYAIEVVQYETLTVRQWFERLEKDPGNLSAEILSQDRTMLYIVDEVYKHGMIIQDILPEVKRKPWFPFVKRGTIDTAGKAEPGTKSQVQIWMEETGIPLRSNYVKIEQGIDVLDLRLRNDPTLGVPLIYFDYNLTTSKSESGRANGILAELGLYRYPDYVAGRAGGEKPVDANNDGVKAVSYFAFDMFGPVLQRKSLPKSRIRRYE